MRFLKNIPSACLAIPVLLVVLVLSQNLFAQGYTSVDSIKAMNLIKAAFDCFQTDPARSLSLSTEGVMISKQIGFIKGIEKGSRTVGDAYLKSGDIKKALPWYTDALNISRQYGHRKDEALTLAHIGGVYLFIGALDKALEYNLQALEIEKTLDDTALITDETSNIGVILNSQGMFDKSIDYFLTTADSYHKIHDSEMEAKSLDYVASNYVSLKKYKEARIYFSRSLEIKRSGETYSNLGDYYEGLHLDDSAQYYFKIALDIFVADSDRLDIEKMLNNIGELETRAGNYGSAAVHLTRAVAIARSLSDVEEIGNAESNLSKLYAKTGDFKNAYQHNLEAVFYKDSLQNVEKARKFEEINTRYEVKELANRNSALQNENALQKLKLQRKNILVLGTASALVGLLVIGILLFRQNKLRAAQQSAELEQKQLRAQMNPHFIFNCLNSIQHFIVANDVKNANKYLSGFALLMRQTLENSKEGIITLRKEIAYLENYLVLERMRFEDKFTYEITCAENVNVDRVEIPSMIIQPFIENAIRHGLCYLEERPGRLKISFYANAGFLCCEVDDNGIGREQSQRLKAVSDIVYESHGMELTRRRLALVSKSNGAEYKMEIKDKKNASQQSEGTVIIIKFPLDV